MIIIIHNSKRNINRIIQFREILGIQNEIYFNRTFSSAILIIIKLTYHVIFKKVSKIYLIGGPVFVLPLVPFLKLFPIEIGYDTYDWPFHRKKLNILQEFCLRLYKKIVWCCDEVIFLNLNYLQTFLTLTKHRTNTSKKCVAILPPIPADKRISTVQKKDHELSIIYVGHFAKTHNIEFFIELWLNCSDTENAKLKLIGQDRVGRQSLLQKQFSTANTEFLGFVKDLNVHLLPGHVGLGPFGTSQKSLDSETNKVLEYMNNGMLVVTGPNVALPKMFPNAPGIFYIDSQNALSNMLKRLNAMTHSDRIVLGMSNKQLLSQLRDTYPKSVEV